MTEGSQESKPGMDTKQPERSKPKAGMLTVEQYKDRMLRRLFRTLDYSSIALSMLVIYVSGIAADYLLIKFLEWISEEELKHSTYLATTFRGIKIGLALLAIVVGTVHGIRSAIEQYRIDEILVREDEKPHV